MIHFIHGLIGEPAHFDAVIRRLNLPDDQIHNPRLDYLRDTTEQLIDQIAAAPRGDEPQIVVGHSMGCMLAVSLPFHVDRFVLLAPPMDFKTGVVPLKRSMIADWVSDLYQQKGKIENEEALFAGVIEMVEAFMADRRMIGKIRTFRAEAQQFLQSPVLRARGADTAILIGAQDDSTPADLFVPILEKTARGADITVLEACGHAVPMEHPNPVAQAILDALDGAMAEAYSTSRILRSSSS